MGIRTFEEIQAWQKARVLCADLYRIFGKSSDYGFRDQIQRASVSIMNNIAEGFERKSRSEFRQFLSIAKGSAGEVRSMLFLASDLGTISESDFKANLALSTEISRMISGLMKVL